MPKQFLAAGLLVLAAGLSALRAEPDPTKPIPLPEVLQERMWQVGRLGDFQLHGFMRTAKHLHPITMRTRDRQIVFEFQEQPLQIRVVMTQGGSIVSRRKSGAEEWQLVSGTQRLDKILDSDVAYEDLGLDFLRWSTVKPIGLDSILTLTSWAYESVPPVKSTYARTRYWISADYLAVLRVDAFNSQGQVIKRVEINGVMKVGDVYTIKEMMISDMIPGRDLSQSRTYIEIRDAKPGSGL